MKKTASAKKSPPKKKASAKKKSSSKAKASAKKAKKAAPTPAPNDNISAAINEYVPEHLRGTDRFLDVVNWNIRYFNELDSSRIRLITKIMGEINADIFALQEIADGALEQVAEALNQSGAGFYKTAYGRTGGSQRVAFLYDTEWVRTKEDFTELFADEPNTLPGTQRRIFPRLPFHNVFLGRSEEGNIDFHLTGVHLKAYMGKDDSGVEQRRLSAERLARWVQDETEDERDVIILGDWNKEPSAPEWRSLTKLEQAGHIRFHAWNNHNEGSHFYRSSKPSRIDLVLVTASVEKVAVKKEANVIPWKGVFDSSTLQKDLISRISDHMPVVSRFYFRDED